MLDVDGTLVDFMRGMWAGLEAAAEHISRLSARPVSALALQDAREAVAADPAWRARWLTEIREQSLRRALGDAGVTAPQAWAEVAATYYAARDAGVAVYPDTHAALASLRARGLTLVTASNGSTDLERVGLAHYFAHTLFAPLEGVSKPDPRFFAHAVQRSGGTPGAALAVGDRHDNDYLPAVEAGLHALLLDRDGTVTDPRVSRIGTLTELEGLIEVVAGV